MAIALLLTFLSTVGLLLSLLGVMIFSIMAYHTMR